jgi:O-acetyl-ADP-ribose deacetylase (regulator of RNase III)
VGGAVVTGPGDYGSLKVPYVIHAVGPNYRDYENNEIYWENGKDQKESFNLDSVHALLKSAYQAALDRAVAHKIKHVAFCLLSAGVFRGSQSLETVLKIGMTGILEWSQAHGKKTATGKKCLSQIVMCAFTEQECWTLKKVCDDML